MFLLQLDVLRGVLGAVRNSVIGLDLEVFSFNLVIVEPRYMMWHHRKEGLFRTCPTLGADEDLVSRSHIHLFCCVSSHVFLL